ncbi:MAG: alpha/beta hydrolase [Chthoniobacterales bacterium]
MSAYAVGPEVYVYAERPQDPLELAVYRPPGMEGERLPAVLLFHGGGWKRGQWRSIGQQCQVLAENGIVGISAGYRLTSQDGVTPADCVQDAKTAMRWVKEHADELEIDPERIAAGGGSAGGHLALSLMTAPEIDEATADKSVSLRPEALVLLNPVLDTGPGGYANEQVSEYWEDFSPRHNLVAGMPPTLMMFGDQDQVTPLEVVEGFAAESRELGNEVEVIIYPGQPHGFFNSTEGENYFQQTTEEIVQFLKVRGF